MNSTSLSAKKQSDDLQRQKLNQFIDLDRYPIDRLDSADGQALLAQCKKDLKAQAAITLPGFIREEVLDGLTAEAEKLVPGSPRFASAPRVTFSELEEQDDHELGKEVRAIKHSNAYNQILNYQIPNDSDLRAIYLWPKMTEFVRCVQMVDQLHLSQCPHLALTMKVAFEGDTDGWHYDPNDGVVTLLLQAPDEGGEFEYAPNIRSLADQNYEGVKRLFENPEKEGRRVDQSPGSLTVFNGRNSMHRVKPVGRTEKPRIVAIFSYDQRPDQVFGNYYIKMIHQLPKGAPA